jgi:hypothetical protein
MFHVSTLLQPMFPFPDGISQCFSHFTEKLLGSSEFQASWLSLIVSDGQKSDEARSGEDGG